MSGAGPGTDGPGAARPEQGPLVRDADLEAAQALTRAGPAGGGAHIPGRWWLALAVVVAASWWLVLTRGRGALFPDDVLAQLTGFLRRLAGAEAAVPAFAEVGPWRAAVGPAIDTVAMSVIGAGLAGGAALVTLAFASRPLTTGEFAVTRPAAGRAIRATVRGLYLITRAVPDYLWALIVVLVLRAGLVAGAVALALHNFGVLGRLGADVVEDLDPAPLQALRSAGAGNLQTLAYGVLPQVLPQLLTFLLYRWEVMIRSSAVVGFVATAGIGYELRLAMSFFDPTLIALLLAVYVLVVLAVDLASSGLRRLAR